MLLAKRGMQNGSKHRGAALLPGAQHTAGDHRSTPLVEVPRCTTAAQVGAHFSKCSTGSQTITPNSVHLKTLAPKTSSACCQTLVPLCSSGSQTAPTRLQSRERAGAGVPPTRPLPTRARRAPEGR
eukprot:TRINITY_DN28733_c0_g1_i1.p3 TRINITY_DN28733_c0_g1~~TRINITY_DN28733_c0_g1_i1.p3  ORF type:complete len:144 (+),score=10.70 TRINITY_DN28733_c0_g1_i1:56-433(+)